MLRAKPCQAKLESDFVLRTGLYDLTNHFKL